MSFEAQCPQCLFVSGQLGQPTPCLLHVKLPAVEQAPQRAPVGDHDEPYVFGQVQPTVDRPGPFTLREYVRLRLLRCRIQEERTAPITNSLLPTAQAQSALSR